MYTISYSSELENKKDYEIRIDVPPEMREFFQGSGEHPLSPLSY